MDSRYQNLARQLPLLAWQDGALQDGALGLGTEEIQQLSASESTA